MEIGKPILRPGGNVGNMTVGISVLNSGLRIFLTVGEGGDGSFTLSRIQELNLDAGNTEITDQESACKTYARLRNDGGRFMLTYKGTLECIESTMVKSNVGTDTVFSSDWYPSPRVEEGRLIEYIGYRKEEEEVAPIDLIWSDDIWSHKSQLTNFSNKTDIPSMNESKLYTLTGETGFDKAVVQVKKMTGIHGSGDGRLCIIELGAEGVALIDDDKSFRAGAHPVTSVDTVGAGGLLSIGFPHVMFQIGMDSGDALEFASTFASVFISKCYGNPPTQNEIMDLMEQSVQGSRR